MRPIDADKALKITESYGTAHGTSLGRHSGVADAIYDEIVKLPTIEAQPVRHGAWLYNDMYLPNCAECSECGWKSSVSGDEISSCHYCPNCGARMVGGDNST